MAKITFDDKVKIKDIPVAEINKFTDANANEIKTVVNGLDDAIYNLETGNEKKPIVSVIWKTGLTFDVIATQFPILNQWEEATPGEVVLEPSDPLLDRIDLIGAFAPVSPATLGLVGKITGDPASTELVVPPDYEPQFFYPIKPVTVKAGATTPTDGSGNAMGTELVYANGTGEPDEWTFSSNSASIINSGGVINATNPALKNKATMTNNADVAGLNSDKNFSLSFDLTLKASMGNSYVVINLLASDGRTMSNSLLFRNGDYGFVSSSLEKQTIVINGLDFSFIILGSFRQLQIAPYKSFAGYTLDNINFHIGSATLPNPNYHTHSNLPFLETLNQEKFDLKLDDTDALTAVTPTNKLITQDDIAGLGGGDMLKSVYDPTNVNGDAFASDLMKNATVAKTTPIDADNFTLWDSVSSSFKKVTWANIKATLKTYFDTIYSTVTDFPDLTNKLDDYAWALSDVDTDLTSGDKSPVFATFDFTLNGFFVSVGTAPTGSSIVVDLKKNGTTVVSTQAQIEVSEFTSLTGVSPVISVASFVKGDKITGSIVQVGSTIAGKDLKIYLDITRV